MSTRMPRRRGREVNRAEPAPAPTPPPGPARPTAPTATAVPNVLTAALLDLLPRPVLVTAAWAAVVVVAASAAAILQQAIGAVSMVVIPVTIAVLFAALLHPFAAVMGRAGLHRVLACLLAVLVPLTAVGLAVGVAGSQVASGAAELATNAQAGVDSVLEWLATGPLHVTGAQISAFLGQAADTFRADASTWSASALDAGVAALDIVAGTAICLIATFFFLLDGQRIWQFCAFIVPARIRSRVHEAGRRGWVSLGAYSRAQIVIAAVDALGITLGALLLGLPLLVPLFVLVFVCSFVPIIGTFLAGLVPVLIAFVSHGPLSALLMLGVVLLVQQVEAHALQPFLMGRAVALHPLAVVLAVAAATYLYGIAGALFSVPVLAFVNSAGRYLLGQDPFPELGRDTTPPSSADPSEAGPTPSREAEGD